MIIVTRFYLLFLKWLTIIIMLLHLVYVKQQKQHSLKSINRMKCNQMLLQATNRQQQQPPQFQQQLLRQQRRQQRW